MPASVKSVCMKVRAYVKLNLTTLNTVQVVGGGEKACLGVLGSRQVGCGNAGSPCACRDFGGPLVAASGRGHEGRGPLPCGEGYKSGGRVGVQAAVLNIMRSMYLLCSQIQCQWPILH